jgi:hypothetical protein
MSGNDKSVSDSLKTSNGSVDDPVSAGPTRPNPTAERLDEQLHSKLQPSPPIQRRNASEIMSYLAPIAIMILVLSPVLIPLVITGAHAIANWRWKPEPTSLTDHRAPAPA